MIDRIRLPIRVDANALRTDLSRLDATSWIAHFNTQYYRGGWSAVALRSVGGHPAKIYPDPVPREPYRDTPILETSPAVKEALSAFACPLLSVRWMKLDPGAEILEHSDYNLSIENGEIRFHVPVITNPDVEFVLAGAPVDMREGEVWYLNFNLPHRVRNAGSEARVHLVIDCVVDDWLRGMLESGAA